MENPLLKKSIWKDRTSDQFRFYCPQCKEERRLPFKLRPDTVVNYFRIALVTLVCMAATWSWFEWRGFVAFFPIWIVFEVYQRVRARAKLACPNCGFDPYLYLVDVKEARKGIEEHWRKKFEAAGLPYPEKDKITPSTKTNDSKDAKSQNAHGEVSLASNEDENDSSGGIA